jgi:hypothetical protein
MSRLKEYLEIAEKERASLMRERLGTNFGRHVGSHSMGRKLFKKEDEDEDSCPSCKGRKKVIDRDMSEYDEHGRLEHARYKDCEDCGGTGKKNETK